MVQVEVKESESCEITKGDFAISNDGNYIVHVSHVVNKETFTGQVVKTNGNTLSKEGEYNATWNIASFRKFYGTITIKCD